MWLDVELKPSEEEGNFPEQTPAVVESDEDYVDDLVDSDGEAGDDHCCDAPGCGHLRDLHIHESDPNDPVTGICAQINKDLEEWETAGTLTNDKLNSALTRFDEALKQTAKHMDALLGKAYVQGELGQSEAAVETLLKAMAIDEKDLRVHTMLAEFGEFDDGLDAPDLEVVEKFMDQKGNPTPKFKSALTEIFNRYAEGEGEKRAITKKGMDKFHHFVNGGPLSEAAMDYLFSGEWDLNSDKNISLTGFISFYLNQTFADPQETVSDLRKLGYDDDLNPVASTAQSAPTATAAPVPSAESSIVSCPPTA